MSHSHHDEHGENTPGWVPGFSSDEQVPVHIASYGFYIGIFLTLIVLTVLTVGLSYFHLGSLNLLVAVVVASIKATLVVLFFMHLKDDRRFNALVFVGSVLFAGVFLAYTLNDTGRRAQVDDAQGSHVLPTGEKAPGGPGEMPAVAPTKRWGSEEH